MDKGQKQYFPIGANYLPNMNTSIYTFVLSIKVCNLQTSLESQRFSEVFYLDTVEEKKSRLFRSGQESINYFSLAVLVGNLHSSSLDVHVTIVNSPGLISLCRLGSLVTHKAHREDSDQPGRLPRLIRVFAGHKSHFFIFFI